jgi:opacity protein-like surface antigen
MSTVKWILTGAAILFAGTSFLSAQTSFDFQAGGGYAWDGANIGGIDNASSINAFGPCTPNSGDPYCQSLPKLDKAFLGLGGDLMLFKHFGVGFEANFQPARETYGPLTSRQTFYDANAIWAPYATKRASLFVEGGIGGARTSFSITESGCVGTAVCSSSTEPVGDANHFQVHFGVGAQIFVTDHIFLKPEYDFRYVPGLDNQFNSNSVSEAMLWIGYSFGER